MELQLAGKTYAVGGASSGLGRAIAEQLIGEGATVIGMARSEDKLRHLANIYGSQFVAHSVDLSDTDAVAHTAGYLQEQRLAGCVFNTGGPPTGTVDELSLANWDTAYAGTLRWKVQLTKALLPGLRERGEGSLLYVESVSIKQPIDNLVLSNAFRAAVAGFVKTLSREEGRHGIRANILAPGYHATDRITTVLEKAADLQGVPVEQIRDQFLQEVPLASLGQPMNFAALASSSHYRQSADGCHNSIVSEVETRTSVYAMSFG